MNPAQMAALMMQLADLRLERDQARTEAIRLGQENDQLKAKLTEKDKAPVEPQDVIQNDGLGSC